jgi:hypothetical protein
MSRLEILGWCVAALGFLVGIMGLSVLSLFRRQAKSLKVLSESLLVTMAAVAPMVEERGKKIGSRKKN